MTQKHWQYFWRRTTKTRLWWHKKALWPKKPLISWRHPLKVTHWNHPVRLMAWTRCLLSLTLKNHQSKITHRKPSTKNHPLKATRWKPLIENQLKAIYNNVWHRHIISKQLMSTMYEGLMHQSRRPIKQETDWTWIRVRTDQIRQPLQVAHLYI